MDMTAADVFNHAAVAFGMSPFLWPHGKVPCSNCDAWPTHANAMIVRNKDGGHFLCVSCHNAKAGDTVCEVPLF